MISIKWLLDDLELRTRKNFDLAVENSKKDYNTIPLTGVKRASLLNDSRYFHVAENLICSNVRTHLMCYFLLFSHFARNMRKFSVSSFISSNMPCLNLFQNAAAMLRVL